MTMELAESDDEQCNEQGCSKRVASSDEDPTVHQQTGGEHVTPDIARFRVRWNQHASGGARLPMDPDCAC